MQTYTEMLKTVQKWQPLKCPSFDKWKNKNGIDIHGYHSTTRKNK